MDILSMSASRTRTTSSVSMVSRSCLAEDTARECTVELRLIRNRTRYKPTRDDYRCEHMGKNRATITKVIILTQRGKSGANIHVSESVSVSVSVSVHRDTTSSLPVTSSVGVTERVHRWVERDSLRTPITSSLSGCGAHSESTTTRRFLGGGA